MCVAGGLLADVWGGWCVFCGGVWEDLSTWLTHGSRCAGACWGLGRVPYVFFGGVWERLTNSERAWWVVWE